MKFILLIKAQIDIAQVFVIPVECCSDMQYSFSATRKWRGVFSERLSVYPSGRHYRIGQYGVSHARRTNLLIFVFWLCPLIHIFTSFLHCVSVPMENILMILCRIIQQVNAKCLMNKKTLLFFILQLSPMIHIFNCCSCWKTWFLWNFHVFLFSKAGRKTLRN